MKKKKLVVFVLLVACIGMVCLTACNEKLYKITDAYDDISFDNIKEITMGNFTPPGTTKTFTSKEDIDSIVHQLKMMEFAKLKKLPLMDGGFFSIQIRYKDETTVSIGFMRDVMYIRNNENFYIVVDDRPIDFLRSMANE